MVNTPPPTPPPPPADRPWALAIEASNPSAPTAPTASGTPGSPTDGPGIALGRWNGQHATLLDTEPLRPTGRHDDDLLPAIARLCDRHAVAPAQLALAAVSAGPGGFTALRISITAAKAIAEATGAALRLVPSWRVASLGLVPSGVRALVCLASKRERVFAVLLADGQPAQVLGSIDSADAIALAPALVIADPLQAPAVLQWASDAGVPVRPPVFSAPRVLELAAECPDADPASAAPIYARAPEAVRLWEAGQRPR